MKKVVLGFFMLAGTVAAYAQDLKAVKKFFDAKEFDKAKEAVDATLAKDDKKAENWYWKHKVYYALATTDAFKNLVPDVGQKGFEALKKSYNLDTNMVAMIKAGDNMADFAAQFNNYYTLFRVEGGSQLDAKNYDASFKALRNALGVSTFFYERKWITTPLDTSITFYTGYAAQNAGNKAETELYYSKLADANASGTDIQIAYGWLTNYYLNEVNNPEKAKMAMERGLKVYPNDEYLKSMKLQLAQKNRDWNEIMKEHETAVSNPAAEFNDYLSYGADLFDYIYTDTASPKQDLPGKMAKMEDMFNKALAKKPGSAETNYLFGMHYSQKILKMNENIKATFKGALNPDQVAKKRVAQAEVATETEKAVKYLDMAATLYGSRVDRLKENEKEHYRATLNNLVYFYNYKKMPDRVKAYEDKLKALTGK
jgi:tetratricopeptide (TPR) repeat protein